MIIEFITYLDEVAYR